MPSKSTTDQARKDLREGKSPSTAAGEFVHEEIEHVREGKHGARSPQQAIAIGLSKARRAGIPLKPPSGGSKRTRENAERDYERGQSGSTDRSRASASRESASRRASATEQALQREPTNTASHRALSKQTTRAASRRSAGSRHAAAEKAVRTKGPAGLRTAAKKAARTRGAA